jgi:3'-5' exoribonuclease
MEILWPSAELCFSLTSMETKRIADFVLDDHIEQFFSVRRKDIRDFKRGRFVSLELGDCSGRVGGVIWEPDQFALEELAEGMVVKIRAVVGEYQNKPQLNIGRIRLAEDGEYTMEEILPHSEQSYDERKSRLLKLREQIDNQHIGNLVDEFFNDERFLDDFLKAAAGKLWHHATVGGLSEHSANVTELALRVAQGYDFLNRDYLTFGGIFHDAGKISAYKLGALIDYSGEGRLIGHICLVDDWICERARRIKDFPKQLLVELRHLILSHHGELQYAAPVVPQMPEAFVLYYCDEIDSKLGAIVRLRQDAGAIPVLR